MKYSVLIKDQIHEVEILEEKGCLKVCWDGERQDVDCLSVSANPSTTMLLNKCAFEISLQREEESFSVILDHSTYDVLVKRGKLRESAATILKQGSDQEIISAPMPGMVVAVKSEVDQRVTQGDPLLILEAMKMENELRSPVDGLVHQVHVQTGKKWKRARNSSH